MDDSECDPSQVYSQPFWILASVYLALSFAGKQELGFRLGLFAILIVFPVM